MVMDWACCFAPLSLEHLSLLGPRHRYQPGPCTPVCPEQCSLHGLPSLGILLVCSEDVFSGNLYSVLIFFFLILSMCVLIISCVGFEVKRLFPAPFSIWCCWNNCSGFFIKDRIMMPSWFRRGCRVNIIQQSDYNWVKSMLNENNKRFIELKRQEDLQH